MDYGKLLSQSWNIVWNNKFMFLLGFLAALGGGGGGNFNFRNSFPSSSSSGGNPTMSPETQAQLMEFWRNYGSLLIAGICFLFILGFVFWLIRLVAQAGLIDSANRLDKGEQATFSEAFAFGVARLGSMMGLSLILSLPTFIVVIPSLLTAIFVMGALGTTGELANMPEGVGIFFVLALCAFCISAPLILIAALIDPFAKRSLVLQNSGAIESIKAGWQILNQNFTDVFLLGILFLVIGFLVGIAAAVILLPMAAVIFVPLVLKFLSDKSIDALTIVWGLGGAVCLGLVGAAINSILTAFRSTAGTLAYKHFIKRTELS